MGRILCGRHGASPVMLVCEHLEADVDRGRVLTSHRTYVDEVDDDGIAFVEYQLCDACVVRLALPVPPRPIGELDPPVKPVCASCWLALIPQLA